jgi:hypothetical protein
MRIPLISVVLGSLFLSASLPIVPPRFCYPPGATGRVTGTVEAAAFCFPANDLDPNSSEEQASLADTFVLSETGAVASGDAEVSAVADSSYQLQCGFVAHASSSTSVVWQLSARPGEISFAASSNDDNLDRIEGGIGGTTYFPALAESEEKITTPLIVEFPFELTTPATVVLRSLTARRAREGCETDQPAAYGGMTFLYCLIHADADGNGHPDAGSLLTADVSAWNGAEHPAPASSVTLPSGRYIMTFWYERWTNEFALANVCVESDECYATVDDHVRAVFGIE